MSVINDMLRDLEARKAPEREIPPQTNNVTQLIEPQTSRTLESVRLWSSVSVLAVFALGLYLFSVASPFDSEEPSQTMASAPAPALATPIKSKSLSATTASNKVKVETESALSSDTRASTSAAFTARSDAIQQPISPVSDSTKHKTPARATEKVREPIVEPVLVEQKIVSTDSVTAQHSKASSSSKRNNVSPQRQTKPDKTSTGETSEDKTKITRANIDKTKSENVEKVALGPTKTISAEALDQHNAQSAQELFNRGEDRTAYRQLYGFIEQNEKDLDSRTVLVTYLLRDNRLAEAGDILVSLPVDQSPDLRQLKARWFVANGHQNMAIYTLNSQLPELGQYPDYYSLLASYYQQFGYPEKAAELYSLLVEHDNLSANWWAGLAISLDTSRNFDDAKLAYEQASTLPGLRPELLDFVLQRVAQLEN